METFTVRAVDELTPVATRVLELVTEKHEVGAVVLALHGDLGAGKTTFMQTLARQLGITETVVSPTFVVMKHYQLPDAQFGIENLYHLDAYRIEEVAEMAPLHFTELLREERALIAIEWAERIEELLPAQTIHLTFALLGEERTLTLTYER